MAFVVYLASHGRPISEILDPALKPLQQLFDGEFAGMTRAEFTCRELEDTRAQLIHLLRSDLTQAEQKNTSMPMNCARKSGRAEE